MSLEQPPKQIKIKAQKLSSKLMLHDILNEQMKHKFKSEVKHEFIKEASHNLNYSKIHLHRKTLTLTSNNLAASTATTSQEFQHIPDFKTMLTTEDVDIPTSINEQYYQASSIRNKEAIPSEQPAQKFRKTSAHKRSLARLSFQGDELNPLAQFTEVKLNNFTSCQETGNSAQVMDAYYKGQKMQRTLDSQLSHNSDNKRIICDLDDVQLLQSDSDSSTRESERKSKKAKQHNRQLNPIKYAKTKTLSQQNLSKLRVIAPSKITFSKDCSPLLHPQAVSPQSMSGTIQKMLKQPNSRNKKNVQQLKFMNTDQQVFNFKSNFDTLNIDSLDQPVLNRKYSGSSNTKFLSKVVELKNSQTQQSYAMASPSNSRKNSDTKHTRADSISKLQVFLPVTTLDPHSSRSRNSQLFQKTEDATLTLTRTLNGNKHSMPVSHQYQKDLQLFAHQSAQANDNDYYNLQNTPQQFPTEPKSRSSSRKSFNIKKLQRPSTSLMSKRSKPSDQSINERRPSVIAVTTL